MTQTVHPAAAAVLLRRRMAPPPPQPATGHPAAAAALLLRRRVTRPALPLPTDFLNAVKTHFLGDPIAAAVPGGIYLDKESRRRTPPYVVVKETGSSLKLVTSDLQVHDTRVQFRLYAEGADLAGGLGDQLENLFRDARLSFTGGWSTRWTRNDRRHVKDEGLSDPGNEVWYFLVEFTTRVKR